MTVNVKGVYNELISITRPRVTSDVLRLLLLLTKCLTLSGIIYVSLRREGKEAESKVVKSLKYDQVLSGAMSTETIDNETKLLRGAL